MRHTALLSAFVSALLLSGGVVRAQIIELTATGTVQDGTAFDGVSNGDECSLNIVFDFQSQFDFCVQGDGVLSCNQRDAPSSFRVTVNGVEVFVVDLFSILASNGPVSLGDTFSMAATGIGQDLGPERSFVLSGNVPTGEAIGADDIMDLESLVCGIDYGRYPNAHFISAPGGVAVVGTDFACGNLSIIVRRDGQVCAQSTGGGGGGPGPAPSAIAAAINEFLGAVVGVIEAASAELNPEGSKRDPIQKALEKARKGLAAVAKGTARERILKALVAFSKFVKGLDKSPVDLFPRFAGEIEDFEELVAMFVEESVRAIDDARDVIEGLGGTVPAKLESKLAAIDEIRELLETLSPTELEYFKVLKKLKYDKIQRSFEKAASKAQKKLGDR